MTTIRIEHDLPRLRAALKRAPSLVLRELDRSLARGAKEIARDARDRAPKATSGLTQSILATRIGQADHVVQATAGHARAVEQGRRPGPMPPVQSIEDWMKARRIGSSDPRERRRSAFAIARAIGRRGTRAQPFMRPALEENRSRLDQLMREGTARAIDKVAGR